MSVFALAGAMIGVDFALWPWNESISMPIPVTIGLILGFLTGVFIVWAVRQVEEIS